jgi:sarcosine oxidase
VPLLRRSFELFEELERDSGEKLFLRTGSMDIGPEHEATFQGSLLSCQTHGLPHEVLTPEQLAARFPAWQVPPHYRACFQPAGGMLFPEKVVAATAALARASGAVLREGTTVVDVVPTGWGVEVLTNSGETIRARKVVLSPGAWAGTLLARSALGMQSPRLRALAGMMRPERQVVSWYAPSTQAASAKSFEPPNFPVWIATMDGAHYYGFPLLQAGTPGLKVGRYHHAFEAIRTEAELDDVEGRKNTNALDRTYTDQFMLRMLRGVRAAPADSVKSQTCVFTNTPDEHFLIDSCPDKQFPQVALLSACSGHGFKFSSVIGEIMASLITRGVEQTEQWLPVRWLDAGRLLGDREPLQTLDPHLEMTKKEVGRAKL